MRIFYANDLGNHSSDHHAVFSNNKVYRGGDFISDSIG